MIKNPYINKFVIDHIANQFRVVLCCGDTLKRDGLGRTSFLLSYLDELFEFEELQMKQDTAVEIRVPQDGLVREMTVSYLVANYADVKQDIKKLCDSSQFVVLDRINEIYRMGQKIRGRHAFLTESALTWNEKYS